MTTSYEQQVAMKEGIANHLSDEYFKARPHLDCVGNRRIFEAGVDRMYWILNSKKESTSSDPEPSFHGDGV